MIELYTIPLVTCIILGFWMLKRHMISNVEFLCLPIFIVVPIVNIAISFIMLSMIFNHISDGNKDSIESVIDYINNIKIFKE